jgi:hypothetical protein
LHSHHNPNGAQVTGGNLAHIIGTASKTAVQAARIAGVLTLWQDLNAPDVQANDMSGAIALAQYYLTKASRLASASTVSAEIDRAEALRKWLLGGGLEAEVLVRDVMNRGPNPLRESPKTRAVLGILERHGWLVLLDPRTVVRGAPLKEA